MNELNQDSYDSFPSLFCASACLLPPSTDLACRHPPSYVINADFDLSHGMKTRFGQMCGMCTDLKHLCFLLQHRTYSSLPSRSTAPLLGNVTYFRRHTCIFHSSRHAHSVLPHMRCVCNILICEFKVPLYHGFQENSHYPHGTESSAPR